MILAETIEIALHADLVATAERLGVTLKRGKANERIGQCPACRGDDQLHINTQKGTWSCNRCGGVIDLVRQAGDLSFRQAVEFLAAEEQ